MAQTAKIGSEMEIIILKENLEGAIKALEKLHKVAKRMGRSIEWNISDHEPLQVRKYVFNPFAISQDDHYKTVQYPRSLITVKVDGGDSLLQFDNARFVAKVEVTEAGNIFHTAPDYTDTLPEALYSHFEHKCDHCGHNRNRVRYYLVEKDGELLQVGSTCVKEFFGINPAQVLKVFEFFEYVRSISDYSGNSNYTFEHVVETVAEMAAGVIMVDGVYRKPETRLLVHDFIHPPFFHSAQARVNHQEIIKQYSDAGIADHIQNFDMEAFRAYVEDMPVNNYSNNLKVIVQNRAVSSNQSFAILVSGVYVFLRDSGQLQKPDNTPKRETLNEWVDAKVKQRLTFENVLVNGKNVFEGYYGETYLYKMQDTEGRILLWFASNESEILNEAIEKQTPVIVTASIKKFDEREFNNTMWKQTVITRAKVIDATQDKGG